MTAQVIQVIHTNLELRGKGTNAAPYRRVEQWWSLDGELLCERDHHAEHEAQTYLDNSTELRAALLSAAERFADLAQIIDEKGPYADAGFLRASAERYRTLAEKGQNR